MDASCLSEENKCLQMSHPGLDDGLLSSQRVQVSGMPGLLPTSNLVWVSEMICAYLQILGPSPGTDVASGPRDTTQHGEEKRPGGQWMDATVPQRSHLELLRDLMGKSSRQEAAGIHAALRRGKTLFNNTLQRSSA